MELKGSFPEVFSAGLGKCTKIKAKFELKENTHPIFRKKRNVAFAATEEINQELDRLVNTGILSKVEFSEWAAPTVYIRKKIYFEKYQNYTSCWERGIIKKRIGDMVYIVEGPKYTHKRH